MITYLWVVSIALSFIFGLIVEAHYSEKALTKVHNELNKIEAELANLSYDARVVVARIRAVI